MAPLPFNQLTVVLDELTDKSTTCINSSIHYHQSMIDKQSRMPTKELHRYINYSTNKQFSYSTIISAQPSNIAQLKKLNRAQIKSLKMYYRVYLED